MQVARVCDADDCRTFAGKFHSSPQARLYRDRFRSGRRARIDRLERAALRRLLIGLRVESALDIPCGAGRLAPVLMEVAARVIEADASAAMLDLARQELAAAPVTYLETDARHIDLADGSVDLVFCHRLLHHIHATDARRQILAEFVRIARRYVLVSYYTPGFRDRARWLWSALRGAGADRPASYRGFLREAAAVGLALAGSAVLRRFPLQARFCLFEREKRP